jgi:alanyl-tRNA synthetase
MMKVDEIRALFLGFFKDKGHQVYPSDSLIPSIQDPSLLFTSAGMNQFKNYFLGTEKPPVARTTSSQKCLRTTDIEKVGKTPAHHTFFEMLGNFSFGDYFKLEAIQFAWEFLTERLHIPKEQLSVSVYEEDKEAYNIWLNKIKIPENEIFRFGENNNFWPANAPTEGPNGPCGPCSEIFYDLGKEVGCGLPSCSVACDCNRFVEIWNLVFMEFERQDKGKLVPLKKKNIDTGMGLERITAVMQNVQSNFDIDIFNPIIKHITDIAKIDYIKTSAEGARIRRMADHSRAIVFLIADGVLPSNEGRGYVERRILRRAVRDALYLGVKKPILHKLVPSVIKVMDKAYPELKNKHLQISRLIKAEEEKFMETVESGIKLLDDVITKLRKSDTRVFPGEEAFRLYDTYGFPVDLTESILYEKNFKLDITGYEKCLGEQREKARASSKIASEIFAPSAIDELKNTLPETVYIGDETISSDVTIEGILVDRKLLAKFTTAGFSLFDSPQITIITDKTPFYAESGGQTGDTGFLRNKDTEFEITDTQKIEKYTIHIGKPKRGEIKVGMKILAEVNKERRQAIACNHTATHLLHHALRTIIGSTVEQSGSLVLPDRLRFDYSMSQAPSETELKAVEKLVNRYIRENQKVTIKTMAFESAKKAGALTLFTEKYPDSVRVISIGDYSKELCGGSHIKQTGEIGSFKIISDSSIAAGTRRIEAITAEEVEKKIREKEKLLSQSARLLETTSHQLPHKIKRVLEKLESAEKKLSQYHKQENNQIASAFLERAETVRNVRIIAEILENKTVEDLRQISDYLRKSAEAVIALLSIVSDNKVDLILMMTPKLCDDEFNAIALSKEIAEIIEGSGGGRKDLAFAGGKRADKFSESLTHFSNLVRKKLMA